jgi:prevent-host-death family protein
MILRNVSEAKAELSALLEAVQKGEEVILAKAGKPVARLTKYEGLAAPRQLGELRGKIKIHGDFKDPLPDDIAEAFGALTQKKR